MCDNNHYMLILESGHQSYFGYAKDSVSYFSNLGYTVPKLTNATDFFLDLVDRDFQQALTHDDDNDENKTESNTNINIKTETTTVDFINKSFKEGTLPLILEEIDKINEISKNHQMTELKHNNFFIQFFVLLKRNFNNNLRNPMTFYIRLFMYSMLCLCLGSMYFEIGNKSDDTQDRISILFFIGAFLTFMSISAMPAFVEERAVYMRERSNNHYSTFSYVIANFFSAIPWIGLISLVCTLLIYGLIQSRLGSKYFGIYLLNLFVALMVAENMMVAISALSKYFMVGLGMNLFIIN